MAWYIYTEGADPELDRIVRRRFGPKFERPCLRLEMIECAKWECQVANSCQYPPTDSEKYDYALAQQKRRRVRG